MRQAVVDYDSQPIRNLFPRPSAESGITSGWGFNPLTSTPTVSTQTTGGFSGAAFRRAVIGTAGSWVNIGHFMGVGLGRVAMTAGQTYTYSIYVRSSVALNMRANVETYDAASGGARITTQSGPTVTLVPNVWTRLYVTLTAAANGWGLLTAYTVSPGVAMAVGDTLEADAIMATEGSTLWPYADGSTPGWAWTGTPHDSVSIGYPYTLESIAGTPLGANTTPGTSLAIPTLPALAGRTLYAVYDTIDAAQTTALPYASTGVVNNANAFAAPGLVAIRQGASSLMNFRCQSLDGAANFANRPNVAGRHCTVGFMVNGDLGFGTQVDGGGTQMGAAQSASGGMGTTQQYLNLASPHAGGNPIAAYVFGTEHNLETRQRVTAWLARKYGSPIPSGY